MLATYQSDHYVIAPHGEKPDETADHAHRAEAGAQAVPQGAG